MPDKLVLDVEKKLDVLFLVLKDKSYHFSVKGPKNEEEARMGRISQEYWNPNWYLEWVVQISMFE